VTVSGSISSSERADERVADGTLYARGVRTLLASWEQYARGARGAALVRLPDATAAVFPHGPQRSVYNNALLARGLSASACARAIASAERSYAAVGVNRFAVWVHERDEVAREELERHRYTVDTVTHFMATTLGRSVARRRGPAVEPATLADHTCVAELPAGLLDLLEESAFEVVVARLHGRRASTAIAFDFLGDHGIYNVGTRPSARRHGLASAVTAMLLQHGAAVGCRTASLQATSMARRLYADLGFRDLGRVIEYVPGRAAQ
jgi:ribosomal protein S18 acetylase RimI-like enzyme